MEKKSVRIFSYFLLSMLLVSAIVLSVQVASAEETPNIQDSIINLITSTIDIVKNAGDPLFRALIGDTGISGADLFVKVLIALLVILIVMAVLDTVDFFGGRPWFQFGIGAIISILGVRFIPNDMIAAIAFPSSVFVASIAIGLPFLLYGVVLHKSISSPPLRRVGWALFATVVVVLWFYNATKPFYYLYPTFISFCIVAFWADGTLHNFLGKIQAEQSIAKYAGIEKNILIGKIKELEAAETRSSNPSEKTLIRRQIAKLKKNL